MSKGRKRHRHSPEAKDPQMQDLKEQLSQALELNQKLQKQNERLEQMVQQLQEEIEYLKRIGKRQAAPFARRHRVEKPKRPGRKAGKGKFSKSQN